MSHRRRGSFGLSYCMNSAPILIVNSDTAFREKMGLLLVGRAQRSAQKQRTQTQRLNKEVQRLGYLRRQSERYDFVAARRDFLQGTTGVNLFVQPSYKWLV